MSTASKVYPCLGSCLVGVLILSVAACTGRVIDVPTPAALPALATPEGGGTPVPIPTLTRIPGLAATLTALPKQPPMPAPEARPYIELRQAVEQCSDYHPNRKNAILQQIGFLLQPATVPPELVALYGDRWPGRMVFGAAYLSALEWKLADRDRASCLYPIGVSFNGLLRQLGEQSFPEFE